MAQKLTVPGTDVVVKPRNPVAVGFLSLTGVYIPFYWYFINKELKQLGEARGIDLGSSPAVSAMAMFPGGLVLAPLMFGFVQDQLNKVWQNLGLDTPYPKVELPPPPGYGYQYPQQQPQQQ